MINRCILAFTPLLLLAACGNDPAGTAPAEQGGEAAGEVLGGTISDDMIALDRLTSQSPPAEPAAREGEQGAEASGGGDDADAETAAESQEAEAASPAAPAPGPDGAASDE